MPSNGTLWTKTSSQSVSAGEPGGTAVPGLRQLLEDDVERQRPEAVVGRLLDPEGDARDELVPAVDDAGVVVAAGEVGDLQRLLQVDRRRNTPRRRAGQDHDGDGARIRMTGILGLELLDFHFLQHFLTGELAGLEGGQVGRP